MRVTKGLLGVTLSAALAAFVLAAIPPHRITAAPQQTVTFRSGVDLVAVDTQVVDKDGQPIKDLASGNFQVWINGQARKVVSADLIQYPLLSPRSLAPSVFEKPDALPRNDLPPVTGRVIVLAVDEVSFSNQSIPAVMQTAKKFLGQLAPDDVIALYAYPFGTGRVDLTHYHNQVGIQLSQVQGMRMANTLGEFEMTPGEAVDIAAGDTNVATAVYQRECLTFVGGGCIDKDGATGGVSGRGAGTPTVSGSSFASGSAAAGASTCAARIRQQAAEYVNYIEQISMESFAGLRELLQGLAAVPGPKTVVLISAGVMASDRTGGKPDITSMMTHAGQLTAAANVTLYAIQFDGSMLDSGSGSGMQLRFNQCQTNMSGGLISQSRDRQLAANGLQRIAGESGGQLFLAGAGSGDLFLNRVLTETSAYYVLGVQPEDVDRDGRVHFIRVKTVDVKNATVRARAQVTIPKSDSK